jgi:hypothetical protein
MSDVSWSDIRTALAAQAALGVGIASATASARGLETIGDLPAVKVITVESIRINDARGGRDGAVSESREAPVVGVLLVARSAGMGEGIWSAEPLVEQMFVVARTGIKLGLDYVEDAFLESADIGEVDYLGETFTGAVLRWIVNVRQTDLNRTA